jgi:hypothetical protein
LGIYQPQVPGPPKHIKITIDSYIIASYTFKSLLAANNVLSDPTAVEITRLSRGLFIVHIARVHCRWIKRDEIFDRLEPFSRIGIVPHRILCGLVAYFEREIADPNKFKVKFPDFGKNLRARAFPFAESTASRGYKVLFFEVLWREVVHGRMTGTEN